MSASKLSIWLSAAYSDRGSRAQEAEMLAKQTAGKDLAEVEDLKALAEAHHAAADVYKNALLKSLK